MNKRGFTLLELLAVVAIVAVVGVGATLAFNNIEDETADTELQNIYVEIQRAANLYLDLHSSDLEWFIQKGNIYYKIEDLKSENYIDADLENPVTKEEINGEHYVKLFIKDDESEVGSCIVDRTKTEGSNGYCIANDIGEYKNLTTCCN